MEIKKTTDNIGHLFNFLISASTVRSLLVEQVQSVYDAHCTADLLNFDIVLVNQITNFFVDLVLCDIYLEAALLAWLYTWWIYLGTIHLGGRVLVLLHLLSPLLVIVLLVL